MASKVDLAFNIFARDKNAEKKLKELGRTCERVATKIKKLSDTNKDNDKFGKALARSAGNAAKSASKYIAVAGAVSYLAASTASAIVPITQLATALAPAAGAVAALPAVVGGYAAAMATAKVATAGVGEAMGAVAEGNAEKLEKAMEDLSPKAKDFVRAFKTIYPELEKLKAQVQDSFFDGMDKSLRSMAETLLGPVKNGMTEAAGAMGGLVQHLMSVAASGHGVEFISTAFGNVKQVISSVEAPLGRLMAALMDLGSLIGRAFGKRASEGLAGLIDKFATFINQAVQSGKALDWVEGAIEVFKALWGIIENVLGIFKALGSASKAAGGDILGVFGTVLSKVNEFFNSEPGQAALTAIFKALGQIGKALGPVIEAVGKGLGTIAPVLGKIAEAIGPILVTIVETLAPALASLGEGLVPVFEALGEAVKKIDLKPLGQALGSFLEALAPLLPLIGEILGIVVEVAAALIEAFSPVIGAAIKAIVDAAQPLLEVLAEVLPQVIDALMPVFEAWVGVIETIAPVLAELVGVLVEQLAPILTDVLIPILEDWASVAAELLPVLAELAVTLLEALMPVIEALMPVITETAQILAEGLGEALLALVPLVVDIVEMFAELMKVAAPLIEIIAQLAGILLGNQAFALKLVIKLVVWLIEQWVGAQRVIYHFVKIGLKALGEFWGFVKSSFSKVGGKIKELIGWFKDIPKKIKAVFGKAGEMLLNSGKKIIDGLLKGIKNGFKKVKNKLKELTSFLPDWKGPMELDMRLLTPSGEAIMDGLVKGFQKKIPAVRKSLSGLTADLANTDVSGDIAAVSSQHVTSAVQAQSTIVIDFRGSDGEMKNWLKKMVRVEAGGDAQRFFGRG